MPSDPHRVPLSLSPARNMPPAQSIFLDQLSRSTVGDRHYHEHTTQNENVTLSTLQGLVQRNSLVSSIQLDTFSVPEFTAWGSCADNVVNEVQLSQG